MIKMVNGKKRIFYLDALRAIAICLVILTHVSRLFCAELSVGTSAWTVAAFGNVFGIMGVPIFLLISGSLLLNREYEIGDFLKRRFSRILIPFIFWALLLPIFRMFVGTANSGIGSYIHLFFDHYWFIWMLIGIYLFLPIINAFINKYGIRFQDLSSSNDVFFILFSMMMAEKIVHVNSYYPLYHTRIHFSESRISSHRDPMNAYLALQKVKDELENVGKLKSQGKYFWEYALMSMQDQLNKCRDEERRKEVLSFLKSQGFNQMGVGSSLYEEAVPQAFKDQYNKFCELETTNPAMKQSMYMEGLCVFSEDKIVDFVNTMKNENKTTGFWGLGSFSKGFIEIVQKNSLSLDYYFDNNPESGKKYNISVLDYKSIDASPDVIVISTTQYFSEIADIISDRNPNTKVICMEDILYDGIS